MKKGSFILYDADLDGLDYISDVQAGKLFKAIKNYRIKNDSSFVSKNPAVNILYSQIIGHISLNEEKYKELCKQNSEIAKKRWNKKAPADTSVCERIPTDTNVYLNDNDNDNDNVNDNDNKNVNDIVNVNDTDACGAKKENTIKNYYRKNRPFTHEGNPSCDTELMKQRVLERYRNIMNQSET